MSDRRVRYILEVDYDGGSAALRAADDLREVDDAAREAGDGLAQAESGFSKLQAGIVTAQAGLAIASEAFGSVQQAAQLAWDTLSDGAALADARGDFADLSAEIGTTADVMENELMAAAGGLKTSAEVIGESSELMALGLGLTKEQIIDLSRVAAELELDMGAMGDAINTGSSRALKEFGFNVQEVKARVAELREEGHSLNEAMAMAMIEAGEEKIERVGARSEETAGQLEILANVVEEVQNEFARGAAEGFAASLERISALGPGAAAGVGALAYGVANFTTSSLPALAEGTKWVYDAMGMGWLPVLGDVAIGVGAVKGQIDASLSPLEAYGVMQEEAAIGTWAAADAAEGHTFSLQEEAAEMAAAAERSEWYARAAEWVADAQRSAASADYVRARSVADVTAQTELADNAADAWAQYTADATARGGDYFTQISQAGAAEFNLADTIYAAADAAGAGAGALADMGVEMGLITEAEAQMAVAATQSQVVAESLAAAAASGKIAWEDYVATVERAIGILQNGDYLIDLGPRTAPEVEDRGFREGWQEDFQADMRDISDYSVVLQADNQAVLAAVEEAKGVVEGFAGPENVYEAVMDMDISGVVEKGEVAKAIIEGLPTHKTVTIDLQITDQALLDQLRAIGALP